MSDFVDNIGNIFTSGLGRAVDNATRAEPQPSPNTQTGADLNVVKTSADPRAIAKVAGTGSLIRGVPNTGLAIGVGSIVVLGLILILARR